jgi:DNA-binding MarR family transcriptional regulator
MDHLRAMAPAFASDLGIRITVPGAYLTSITGARNRPAKRSRGLDDWADGALGAGMPPLKPSAVTPTERRRFEAARNAATLQLLFKASRLANERALARAASGATGESPIRPAHTALFPHLDFEGIRLTELAARVGVTKQAVGQLVDDLVSLGMVERIEDPTDKRAKRIRFSRLGYHQLMHGLGVLRDIEGALRRVVGARRMRELHETLTMMIQALERPVV